MPDIPPKPQLILASLDTDTSPLRWWLRVDEDSVVRCDMQPNVLPVRVLLSRLIPVRVDYHVDAGDWRAIRDCHSSRVAVEAEER